LHHAVADPHQGGQNVAQLQARSRPDNVAGSTRGRKTEAFDAILHWQSASCGLDWVRAKTRQRQSSGGKKRLALLRLACTRHTGSYIASKPVITSCLSVRLVTCSEPDPSLSWAHYGLARFYRSWVPSALLITMLARSEYAES
jgi:hypothetical protein